MKRRGICLNTPESILGRAYVAMHADHSKSLDARLAIGWSILNAMSYVSGVPMLAVGGAVRQSDPWRAPIFTGGVQ
jgi:hypothetical protein